MSEAFRESAYRIVPAGGEWIASQNPAERHPGALEGTMPPNGGFGILGAGRSVSASRWMIWRNR